MLIQAMRGFSLFLVTLSLVCFVACAPESPETAEAPESAPPEAPADPTPASEPSPAETAAESGGPLNVDEQGRAIRGYDAVAYHADGTAVAGDPSFTHNWSGADWLFSTAENRDLFAQDPEKYAPNNGGYCTFGVVLKKKLDVDPDVFMVEQDELFLFLNPEVKEKFVADQQGNLALVAAQWPEIADKHPDELVGEGG